MPPLLPIPIPALIEKKRDGGEMSKEELRSLIGGFVAGEVADSQMSAFAMAVFFQGMTARETWWLTEAMLHSGKTLPLPPKNAQAQVFRMVDKHSTGGIGDKTSLVLAPLLARAGARVPMISGRGLGITGGTLDKLESISGYRTDLTLDEISRQLDEVGCVITGQTPEICPADRKLYALRDVTGTVPSRPLIVASIMSKKLAESLDALVLDVKFGSGAFMKTRDDAGKLAAAMVDVGVAMGVKTTAVLSPMDEPLGRAAGNALEVTETLECLRGHGPADLRELVLDLAAEVVEVDRPRLGAWLDDGSALEVFHKMVAAQGGDLTRDPSLVHAATVIREVPAPHAGEVRRMDAGVIGRVALELGAGRTRPGESVDFSVGFDQFKKIGEPVSEGECLLRIHARSEAEALRAEQILLREAIDIR